MKSVGIIFAALVLSVPVSTTEYHVAKTGDDSNNEVKLVQKTEYPWQGAISLYVEPKKSKEFAIMLRIPGWTKGEVLPGRLYEYLDNRAADWTVSVNGQRLEDCEINQAGYVEIDRKWAKGDKIDLLLPMKIRKVTADNRIECNKGKVAIERGPIVYCAEGADNKCEVLNFEMDKDTELNSEFRKGQLGGGDSLERRWI